MGSRRVTDSLVTGQVLIAAGSPALSDATVHVSLEDVSFADGPATTVAETVIRHVTHPPAAPGGDGRTGPTAVAFALRRTRDSPAIDARHHYAVRVWVDRDGDGRAGPGDLYSDQRHPVLTRGHPGTVTIKLGSG